MSFSECPCTDILLMRSIMDSPLGVIFFALDTEYKYLYFSKTHAQTMKSIWGGVQIENGLSLLDIITVATDRRKAKNNFDRALGGEYFTEREEYGNKELQRLVWKNDYAPVYDELGEIIGVSVFVVDLTESMEAEKKSRIAELQKEIVRERELLLNSIGEGIYGVDTYGKCFFINPAGLKILGFEKDEILGKVTHTLIHHHKVDGTIFIKDDCIVSQAFMQNKQILQRDWMFRKNGEMFPVEITATPMIQNSQSSGVVVSFRDITEQYIAEEQLKKSNEQLHIQSITDPLTQLYNRRYLMDIGLMQFQLSRHNKQPLSVLAFDIDHFKNINDTYGHDIGDEILIKVSQAAKESLRSVDILARVGGEEFTVILVDTNTDKALEIAQRLQKMIREAYVLIGQKRLTCTVSIGVVTTDETSQVYLDLLKRADSQLYKAKNNGRDRIEQ